MTRILITGSRYATTEHIPIIESALERAWRTTGHDPYAVLVHGAAPGVDSLARDIWLAHGLVVEAHPADWALLGRRAGPLRNREMVNLGADLCLGFPLGESRGTRGCMMLAREASIPVIEIDLGNLPHQG